MFLRNEVADVGRITLKSCWIVREDNRVLCLMVMNGRVLDDLFCGLEAGFVVCCIPIFLKNCASREPGSDFGPYVQFSFMGLPVCCFVGKLQRMTRYYTK